MLTKLIQISLFSALIVAIIFALPDVRDYPLSDNFTSALTLIFGYLFAWAQVFTAINTLLAIALFVMFIEAMILAWRIAAWIIGFMARALA